MEKFKIIRIIFFIVIAQFYIINLITIAQTTTETEYIISPQNAEIIILEILTNKNMFLEDRLTTALKMAEEFDINILSFIENDIFFKKEDLTSLLWAAKEGHDHLIPLLLAAGADPNIQNKEGSTPLMLVQNPNMVKVLFDYQANPNFQDNIQETALHNAIRDNNITKVKELLKNTKLKIDIINQKGQTALHLAALLASAKIIELLLKAGAQKNIQDTQGNTPLHNAVEKADPENIAMLLAYGADKNIQDTQGNTPLDLLDESGPDSAKINKLLQK